MPLQARTSYAVQKKLRPFYTGGKVEWDPVASVLLAQSEDKVCKVDLATGEESGTFAVDEDQIVSFAFSPDRQFVVTSHKSGLLRQWNYADGEVLKTWKTFHKGPIPVLSFDSSSTLVASGGSDSSVKIWDVVRQYCTHTLKGCQGVVSIAMFHTSEHSILHVFAAATDNTIIGWNLETSEAVHSLVGHISTVTAIEASPDPNILLSCGRDGVVRVWSIREQKAMRAIAAMEALEDLKFLPPGAFESHKMGDPYFVTGGAKGALRVWSLPAGKVVGKKALSQNAGTDGVSSEVTEGPTVVRLAVTSKPDSPDSSVVRHQLRVVTFDHNFLTFDLPSFSPSGRLVGNNDDVLDARFVGTNDRFLAVASNSSVVKVYDLETTSCEFLEGHSDAVVALSRWVKMPHVFSSGSKDKLICVWKKISAEGGGGAKRMWVRCAVASGHTAAVTALGCSHAVGGGKFWLASASEDTTVKLWSMSKVNTSKDAPGECVSLSAVFTEIAHENVVNSVCFSPNDMLLATGSQDHTAKLWTVGDGGKPGLRLKGTFRGHRRGVWCVAFSPVDQILATGSTDATVRLWSVADFACLKTFEGHSGSVLRASFVNGGTQVLTASADGLVKLWSVKTALCSLTLDEHEDRIWALDVNKKGTGFVSGSADGTTILWRDDTEEQVEKKAAVLNERLEQEQLLANLLNDGKFFKALGLALSLEQPLKALLVIRAMMNSGSGDFAELERTLRRLNEEQVAVLIRFLSIWNTNGKNYFPAQVTLNILLRQRTVDELVKHPAVAKALPGLLSYSRRHKARLERLRQAASFVRFVQETVKATAGSGVDLTQRHFDPEFEPTDVKEEPGSDHEESGVVPALAAAGNNAPNAVEPRQVGEAGEEDVGSESESNSESGSGSDPEAELMPRLKIAPPLARTAPRIVREKLDVEDMDGNLDVVPGGGISFEDEDDEGDADVDGRGGFRDGPRRKVQRGGGGRGGAGGRRRRVDTGRSGRF